MRTVRWIGLGAFAALAGCQTAAEQAVTIGPYPSQYREIAAGYLRGVLIDPYSVRDAVIAKPKLGKIYVDGTLGKYEEGWAVCYRLNSKNRTGGYTGPSTNIVIIRDGRAVASSNVTEPSHYDIRTQCGDASFEPFPEIPGKYSALR